MSESVRSRDAMSAKDLMRDTFGTEKLTKKQLARLGDLMTRRFNEGGEVEKESRNLLPPDRSKGFKEEGISVSPPPAQVRTYLNTLFGEKSPITERNFTKEELGLMLDAIKRARAEGRDYVDYTDYNIPLTGIADLDLSTQASIRNTLGGFKYEIGKDNRLRGRDRYDFDRDLGGRSSKEYAAMSTPEKLWTLLKDTANVTPAVVDFYRMSRMQPLTGKGGSVGPFTLPHRIGAAFMPPEGREVNVDLGEEAAKEVRAIPPKKKKRRQ
jgi:hypothetical protein